MGTKKKERRFIWAFILICYGIYSFVRGIGYKDISELAMGTLMGQGSIFGVWGLKEWMEYSIKKRRKENDK